MSTPNQPPRRSPARLFFSHNSRWATLFLGLSASVLLAGRSVAADLPEIQQVTVGFNGQYKTGYWTPVRLTVQGGSAEFRGQLTMTALDGDGIPVQHVWGQSDPIVIPAGGETVLERQVKFGRRIRQLPVSLIATGTDAATIRRVVEIPPPLASDRELILSWGPSIGLETALRRRSRSQAEPPAVYSLSKASDLPESWLGYESVNMIVLTTSDEQALSAIGDRQWDALREWLELGGRLLLCVGSRGAQVLDESSPVAALAPGKFVQVTGLRSSSPLETFLGTSQRLNASDLPAGIPMTVLDQVRGRVELFDQVAGGRRPMIIRGPLGLGQVVFVAFDLDQPPFVDWEGRSRFLQLLIRSTPQASSEQEQTVTAHSVQFGYRDISGQLRSALDQFPGVTMAAFSWVAGLLLLYVLLIGPFDYFLLKDVLRRMPATWLTFPLIAIAFTVIALLLGQRLRGDSVQFNQLDLVDVDVQSGTVRGTSWAHLYSPDAAEFDLALQPIQEGLGSTSASPEKAGCVVAWQGLPGLALGGLDSNTAAVAGSDGYLIEFAAPDHTRIKGMPLPEASTRSFLGRWWSSSPPLRTASLSEDADGLLRGELVNPLPVRLTDCVVMYKNWLYRLDSRRGTLESDERTRMEVEQAFNLQWRLSGRRVVGEKDVSTPWDLQTLDVDKILEMMMFYGAAGGETYTQLTNSYQNYIDLSTHLQTSCAVLVGHSLRPATRWSLNGQASANAQAEANGDDQQVTYYRVIFPVEPYRD